MERGLVRVKQNLFTFGHYHYYSGKCTPHNIRDHLLQKLVLENLQRTLGYVKNFEHIFIYQQQKLETEQNIQDIKYKKDEIRKANARINELNLFFTHIYKDNVIGKLSALCQPIYVVKSP